MICLFMNTIVKNANRISNIWYFETRNRKLVLPVKVRKL